MICSKCGKEIESGDLCDQCLAEEFPDLAEEKPSSPSSQTPRTYPTSPMYRSPAQKAQSPAQTQTTPTGNPRAGLKLAIPAMILAFLAFSFASFVLGFVGALENLNNSLSSGYYISNYNELLSISSVMTVFSIILTVAATPLSAISIVMFVKEKKSSGRKAIATIVLGILSLAYVLLAVFTLILTRTPYASIISSMFTF